MTACAGKRLDPGRKSPESMGFEGGLRRKIVGQDEAVQAVVDLYQVFRAGPEFAWAAGGEPSVPRTDGSGQDARGGSHGGSAVRRSAGGD